MHSASVRHDGGSAAKNFGIKAGHTVILGRGLIAKDTQT